MKYFLYPFTLLINRKSFTWLVVKFKRVFYFILFIYHWIQIEKEKKKEKPVIQKKKSGFYIKKWSNCLLWLTSFFEVMNLSFFVVQILNTDCILFISLYSFFSSCILAHLIYFEKGRVVYLNLFVYIQLVSIQDDSIEKRRNQFLL